MRILFSCAGRRVELMECFRDASKKLGVEPAIFAADCNPRMSAACHLADQAFEVPRCDAPGFVPAMLDLCREHRVDLIVPTIDTELEALAANADLFARAGTTVSISNSDVVRICRDKLATRAFLKSIGIPVPRTASLEQFWEERSQWNFPVILKVRNGSSSRGIIVCHAPEDLPSRPPKGDYIAQECWSGKEYTVNLFFDRGGLRCAVPHFRRETRGGEVSRGITERIPLLAHFARALGEAWRGQAFGALCFQSILTNDGKAVVFEINARFGGGYPLAHRAGANFARWLLESRLGLPCSARDDWQEGLSMLRYDSSIFFQENA